MESTENQSLESENTNQVGSGDPVSQSTGGRKAASQSGTTVSRRGSGGTCGLAGDCQEMGDHPGRKETRNRQEEQDSGTGSLSLRPGEKKTCLRKSSQLLQRSRPCSPGQNRPQVRGVDSAAE